MEYLLVTFSIVYVFYYLIYKFIREIGLSYIFWHIWHTLLCVGLAYIWPMNVKMKGYVYGNCILSFIILFYVIVGHYEIIEEIKKKFSKKDHK